MVKNKNFEFHLEDAKDEEKELIIKGTIKDKLNTLALLCARNPSEANYKQLLMFCENQRNDVIYMTLKLLRDLIKEEKNKMENNKSEEKLKKVKKSNTEDKSRERKFKKDKKSTFDDKNSLSNSILDNYYIKGRIIKSFEMGVKNQYIKDNVVEIVGVLIRSEIFAEEFIDILISRLIEKGKTLVLVENALKSVFAMYEEQMYYGFEDFYFKNDNFRHQHSLLKFIQNLDLLNSKMSKLFFNFYNQALSNLEEYPQDQKDLMIELLVNGLASTIKINDDNKDLYKIEKIDLIRKYIKTPRSIISCLNLLLKTNDLHLENYVVKASKTSLLRNSRYEPEFLNMIIKIESKDMFKKLIDSSFSNTVASIISYMILGYFKGVNINEMFSLRLFTKHYHPIVRDLAYRILKGDKIQMFDPFDKVFLDGMIRTLEKHNKNNK